MTAPTDTGTPIEVKFERSFRRIEDLSALRKWSNESVEARRPDGAS